MSTKCTFNMYFTTQRTFLTPNAGFFKPSYYDYYLCPAAGQRRTARRLISLRCFRDSDVRVFIINATLLSRLLSPITKPAGRPCIFSSSLLFCALVASSSRAFEVRKN